MAKFEYRVTRPMLPPGAISPVMDNRGMEWWLNDMAAHGWEFVSYGATHWHGKEQPQQWWIFKRPRKA